MTLGRGQGCPYIGPMKRIIPSAAFALSLSLLPVGLPAQEAEKTEEDGFSLMEEGARLILKGIMEEMEPAIEEFEGLAEELRPAFRELAVEMGPALIELLETVDSFSNYHPPEVLPNGDIILRRRDEAPEWVPPEGEEIDL